MKSIYNNFSLSFLPKVKSAKLIVGTGLWVAVVCNFPLWKRIYNLEEKLDIPFILAFALLIAGLSIALLSILAWGKILKPVLSIFVLAAAAGAYFMNAYGVVIDKNMLTNVLQTDTREAADLINIQMLFIVMALSAPAIWFIWRNERSHLSFSQMIFRNSGMFALGLIVAVASLMLVFQTFSSIMRNHKDVRYLINPLNSIYALAKITVDPLKKTNTELVEIGEDANVVDNIGGMDLPILVLVVGETARADHFQFNGYERETSPYLSKREDIISYSNAWACGTSTAESLPCMFSHLKKEEFFDRDNNYENLLDVLQRAGLNTIWIDNQSGCKGVCARIDTINQMVSKENPSCYVDGCFDVAMLEGLQSKIEKLSINKNSNGVVVVLHQMGSHGPAYFKRSSSERKKYFPECSTSALQSCSKSEVVNAYDNSIIETDYFVSKTIDWLTSNYPRRSTAMMYVSDHGESLGENNIYLHGLPYAFAPDAQKMIPWIVWFSSSFKNSGPFKEECIEKLDGKEKITHDNYFHTVLGLLNVSTSLYSSDLDVFGKCRRGML